MRRFVLAAFVAALVLSAPAQAQIDRDWRARAGIEKAKAVGIQIDPAVEEAMARAPVGSCPNDPSQPKCPKATSVVVSPTTENPDGSVSFAPDPTEAGQARAADFAWNCTMRMTGPYQAAGYAQMETTSYCDWRVSAHELYGSLIKRVGGNWYTQVTKGKRAAGGQRITLHVTDPCQGSDQRYWQAHAEGWALLSGRWYLATRDAWGWLPCQ